LNLNSVFDITERNCQKFIESFEDCADFVEAFKKEYRYFISYHASNLDEQEIKDVKSNGLLLTNTKFFVSKAKRKLILETDSNDLKQKLNNKIDSYFRKPDYKLGQGVYLCFAKESLIEESYHYLLFGSEDLQYLASALKNEFGILFKNRLIESGLHVLVKVKIPLEKVESYWFDNIFNYWNKGGFESAIVVRQSIPSKWVIGIEVLKRPEDTQKLLNC